MADVYRAIDMHEQGRPVALKLFKTGFLDSRLSLEAFSRETKSLHELNEHPNVTKLIDCGTDSSTGRKYIALEWVQFNLLEHIKDNPIADWDEFYEKYGRSILQALCFAYVRSIIHRDIKPQNILVSSDLQVKVCDFGISKFKRYYQPGATLISFASPPYAPPETDSGEFSDSRDCYGFSVLALECLGRQELTADAKVPELMALLSAPTEVLGVLLRAVSMEPSERPSNVQDFFDELEAIRASRASSKKPRLHIFLRLTKSAEDTLRSELNDATVPQITKYVLNDLSEAYGIDRWKSLLNGKFVEAEDELALFGGEFRYRLILDNTCPGRFSIVWVGRMSPARLEGLRERAWTTNIQFEFGTPPDVLNSTQMIEMLLTELDEYITKRRVEEEKRRDHVIFEKWSALLRLNEDLQRDREAPIRYEAAEADGNRLVFRVAEIPEGDLIGQARVVRAEGRQIFAGIIDSLAEQQITLYTEVPITEDIPARGEIVVDTRLERTSIDRQLNALDAVRFDRARRTDLRRLLVAPSACRAPRKRSVNAFFHEDLDESQRFAVEAALGADDFFVVEGPPGTGKTKFISELVLQVLRDNPKARVLLSSQTHNALDNAIERIRPLAQTAGLGINIVRIALRTDVRVSTAVKDLLLENQVDRWLTRIGNQSQEFLDKWATQHGLSKRNVDIGLAISKFRTSRAAVDHEVAKLNQIEKEILSLEVEEKNLRLDEKGADKLEEVRTKLETLRRDLIDARSASTQTRRDVSQARKQLEGFGEEGKDLATFSDGELAEWEQDYIGKSNEGQKLTQLIELVDEWYARFGRSRDFFGAFVAEAQVIAGTCVAITGRGLQDVDFDVCIVDESSKATPTEILVPLSRSKKWVIVGDKNQLSPFKVGLDQSHRRLEDYDLTKDDLDKTLLDHLIVALPIECRTKLLYQHRMVKEIGSLISDCFYDGELNNSRAPKTDVSLKEALPKPVTWFSTSRFSDRKETSAGRSFKNFAEVRVVRKILDRLQGTAAKQNKKLSVVVLSGYLPQISELLRATAASVSQYQNLSIEYQTVDRYQGREADVAIYSVTRSNTDGKIGFLKEFERLNVALSRARIGLAIVGDSYFCANVKGDNPFMEVLRHIRGHGTECGLHEATP